MTATTSPSGSSSPSEPRATTPTATGPAASKEASHSSSTHSNCGGLLKKPGAPATSPGQEPAPSGGSTCIKRELARLLLALRTERGWSVYDVERRSGVSRSTLSRMERAVTDPTVTMLAAVCRAYGYRASRLLAEAEALDQRRWPG
ncbi:helix-turn-helix domain-containing protein [Streptomyces tendae]|uniref:helix-turn-helix domain-containing protein n=1 Tax=Streptomyces tendae TaxID=1932 RepID=UPI003712458B